jgi:hypothetical protein
MRQVARAAVGLLAVMMLMAPERALAAEDPDPVTWPTVTAPGAGSGSDPVPVQWAAVAKPDLSGPDPGPVTWPQPQPG